MRFLCPYVFKQSWKRLLAAFFDGIGFCLFFIPNRLKTPLNPDRVKKILVIRLDHLGDAAMTRPARRLLRERFPQAQIDLLVSAATAPLFRDTPGMRNILVMEHSWFTPGVSLQNQCKDALRMLPIIKNNHYDLAVDFRGDLRHILLMFFARIPWRFGLRHCPFGFMLRLRFGLLVAVTLLP